MNSESFEDEMLDADSFGDEFESDAYDEFEDSGESLDELSDGPPPPRPPRTGSGTIPVGPFRTQIACLDGQDDLADLALSLSLLNTARRQFPRRVAAARIGVRAVATRIINRVRSGFYRRRGCTRLNLRRLAARVRRLSWPAGLGLRPLRDRVANALDGRRP